LIYFQLHYLFQNARRDDKVISMTRCCRTKSSLAVVVIFETPFHGKINL